MSACSRPKKKLTDTNGRLPAQVLATLPDVSMSNHQPSWTIFCKTVQPYKGGPSILKMNFLSVRHSLFKPTSNKNRFWEKHSLKERSQFGSRKQIKLTKWFFLSPSHDFFKFLKPYSEIFFPTTRIQFSSSNSFWGCFLTSHSQLISLSQLDPEEKDCQVFVQHLFI